jgi:hypothetical protein
MNSYPLLQRGSSSRPHLRTSRKETVHFMDPATAEAIGEPLINKQRYVASSKEQFFQGYAALILFMKRSHDVRIRLFAALIQRYSGGQEFSLSKGFKEIIAKELGCSARSFDTVITELVKDNIIVRINNCLYKVNPFYVFTGSFKHRTEALKFVLELDLDCKDCK